MFGLNVLVGVTLAAVFRAPYPIIDVSSWSVVDTEASGADEKSWLGDPDNPGQRWLFKPVPRKVWGFQGDDWAEKVTTELARLLGVPCAQVELAVRNGDRGTISLDLAPTYWERQSGAVVLSGLVQNYQPGYTNPPGRPGHSLANIHQILASCNPPPGCDLPASFDGFSAFSGYTLLDAWVANRDRHDENWAVLRPPEGSSIALCGSYDHGSTLGFNLQDGYRASCLEKGTVEQWAARGTAYRFEHDRSIGPVSLVDLAGDALDLAGYDEYRHWTCQLQKVSAADVYEVVESVPGLSEVTRNFVLELLCINQRRLLNACC